MNYELKNEQLSLTFKSLGAEVTSIKDCDGIEYLWQGDPNYWSGQSPHMFPICGSLRNKTAMTGNGMECKLERHGIARRNEFVCTNQTDDSITFSLEATEATKEFFPYQFKLEVTYTLKNKTMTTTYTTYNHDTVKMPFFIGAHPAFNCPIFPDENFEDYIVEFEEPELVRCPHLILETGLIDTEKRTVILDNEKTIPLTHNLFSVDTIIFDELKSRSVTCYNPKTGKGIREDFADFSYLLLWSAPNAPFVALEPCSGNSTCLNESDVFEEKRGVTILDPNESKSFSYDTTVL